MTTASDILVKSQTIIPLSDTRYKLAVCVCVYACTVRQGYKTRRQQALPIINPDQCTHAGVAAAHRHPREQRSTSTRLRTSQTQTSGRTLIKHNWHEKEWKEEMRQEKRDKVSCKYWHTLLLLFSMREAVQTHQENMAPKLLMLV